MKIIQCDTCLKQTEIDRKVYTVYPDGWRRFELDSVMYEFCSVNCLNIGMKNIANGNDLSGVKVNG